MSGKIDHEAIAQTVSDKKPDETDSNDPLLEAVAWAPEITPPVPVRGQEANSPRDDYASLPVIDASHYVFGEEVARGGMGRIRAARDRRLGRVVAIKQIAPGATVARFEREALITARLQHPAIVPIYEAGRLPSGKPFYAMRLIPGKSLDREVAGRKQLAERMALLPNLITAVDAVAYAHSNRVIHRDLKPANILVGEFGETVVIDWGLAKNLDEAADHVPDAGPYRDRLDSKTLEGSVLGTPAYMAPEQARGEAVDERADVYALGAVLYCVLAGAPPVRGSSVEELLKQTEAGAIEPLSSAQAAVPEDLAAIVAKALSRDPSQRYPNAAGLARDLKRFQTGQLVGAHRYSTWQLLSRQIRRHRTAVAVGAIAVVFLIATIVVYGSRLVRAKQAAERASRQAEDRRKQADSAVLQLMIEQARNALATGAPGQALAYLTAATSGGADPVRQTLLSDALRPFEAESARLDVRDPTYRVAVDRRNQRIATAHAHGVVQLWDAGTGLLMQTLASGDAADVFSVAFNADGTHIVTTSADGRARIWDVTNGKIVLQLPVEDATGALFASDDTIVTSGPERTETWDIFGKRRRVFEGVADLRSGAVSDDSRHLVTFDPKHDAVTLWNLGSGKSERTFDAHEESWARRPTDGRVLTAAISPDGSKVAAGTWSGYILVWSTQRTSALASLGGHRVSATSVTFSPDGQTLVSTSGDGEARLWNLRTRDLLRSYPTHNNQPFYRESFSPDGTHVAIAMKGSTVLSVRLARLDSPDAFEAHSGEVLTPQYISDGELFAIDSTRRAVIWNVRKLEQNKGPGLTPPSVSGQVASIVPSPTLGPALVLTSDGRLSTFDWRSQTVSNVLKDHPSIRTAAYSPDGGQVLLATADDIEARDAYTWALIARLPQEAGFVLRPVGFTDDRGIVLTRFKVLADGPQYDSLQLWHPGKEGLVPAKPGTRILEGTSSLANSLAEDGRQELVFQGQQAWIEDRASERRVRVFDAGEPIQWVTFSPDKRAVWAGLLSDTVKVWNASTGELRLSMKAPSVAHGAFSRDSRLFAAYGSTEGSIWMWDATNGNLLGSLDVGAPVENLVFEDLDGAGLIAATPGGELFAYEFGKPARSEQEFNELLKRNPWRYESGHVVPVVP